MREKEDKANYGKFTKTTSDIVPGGWDIVNLGKIAKIQYGKAKPKNSGEIPVVGSGGIYAKTNISLVNFPTLVIGRKGTAGSVWLCLKQCYPSDTTFYLDWKEEIDILFLYNYMLFNPLSGEHAKTTLPSLQKPDLEKYLIPYPPIQEQKKIAGVLSAVQEAKEKTEEVIRAAKELKKSLLKHLFTYGPVSIEEAQKVKLKETEIGMVPEDWESTLLSDIANIKYGKSKPKTNGNIPVVGSGGIYSTTNISLIEYPTIIIGRKGTAGKIWLLFEPSYPSDTTFYLEWKREIDIKYLFNFMVINPLSGEHAKTTLPSLQKPDLEKYVVITPSLLIQQKISGILSTIDKKIESEENKKKALEELFKTLLNNLMTGKIRVHNLDIEV